MPQYAHDIIYYFRINRQLTRLGGAEGDCRTESVYIDTGPASTSPSATATARTSTRSLLPTSSAVGVYSLSRHTNCQSGPAPLCCPLLLLLLLVLLMLFPNFWLVVLLLAIVSSSIGLSGVRGCSTSRSLSFWDCGTNFSWLCNFECSLHAALKQLCVIHKKKWL